ncbi:MAG: hybrid sensor histidine kinase/response regulator [Syntrophorhabdaceae bacterium]
MKDPPRTNQELLEEIAALQKLKTECERADEQLKQQADAIEASMDGIGILDKDQNYVYLNEAHTRIYGYAPGELTGRSWRVLYDENELRRFEYDIMPEFSRKRQWRGEATGKKKDGSLFPQEVSLTALDNGGLICVVRDITERKQAEEEYQRMNAFLYSIVENIPNMIFIKDAGELRFVRFNKAGEDLLGSSREDLIGKNDYDFFPKEQADFFTQKDREVLAGKEVIDIPEEPVQTRVKGIRSIHTKKVPILDAKGEPQYLLGISEDITERKKLEAQLMNAQRMEAVGTLAGGIAHDFNNMLAVILGNAELALDDVNEEGPRDNLKQILKASKRSRDLVKQILAFSRKSEGQKKTLKLGRLVRETVELLRGSLPSTIIIELDINAVHDSVFADPSQIQQVLMNLSTNAAHAMSDEGGTLSISLSETMFSQEDTMPDRSMQPGRYVVLAVADTGTGIPEKITHRIFEPFYTTKEQGQGTGMGLAVVFGIVKECEGAITVESTVGKGSVFKVFFPASEPVAEVEARKEESLPAGKERVLVVDDEPSVAEMITEMLKRLGYKVTTAGSGLEGWKKFEDAPHAFDLVITDHVMPGLTGIRLAEMMLDLRKELPIILFTGYSETVSPEKAKAVGISAFLMKPVVKTTLAETVRQVLDGFTC